MSRFWLRRRRLLLPGFQLRYLVSHLAFLAFLGFALACAVFAPLAAELRRPEQTATATHFLWLHRWFWPIVGGALSAAALHAIWMSHRVAGPIYRFRLIFDRLAAGDLSVRVRVRDDDYLTAEAEHFDVALAAIRDRVSAVQASVEALTVDVAATEGLSEAERRRLELATARVRNAAATLRIVPGAAEPPAPADARARIAPLHAKGGFTLLEILVAVALVAVLAAIAIPAM